MLVGHRVGWRYEEVLPPFPHNELVQLQPVPESARLTDGMVRPGDGLFAASSQKVGHPERFSATAIHFCLTVKVLFGLPLRQATGFVESLLNLSGLD